MTRDDARFRKVRECEIALRREKPSGHIPRYASRVLLLTEALQALPAETQDAAYGAPVLDILATSLERLAAALE